MYCGYRVESSVGSLTIKGDGRTRSGLRDSVNGLIDEILHGKVKDKSKVRKGFDHEGWSRLLGGRGAFQRSAG